jgi:hypothetical protein
MVFHPSVFPVMTCFALVFEISFMLYVDPCLLGSLFLDPEDVRSLSLGAIWNFGNGAGLPWLGHQITGHKCLCKRPMCIGTDRAQTHSLFYSIRTWESFQASSCGINTK